LNNKILITGGAGFLGSRLTEKLLKDGNNVLVVDNYFTGSKGNLEHLLPNPRLELIRHDVTFPLYVETNQIYNLALAQPRQCITNMTQCKLPKQVCMVQSICWV
jgi:nucleoside-diphosphate-sugar epimerase